VIGGINETIAGKFNDKDYNELYSAAALNEQKYTDFAAHCKSAPSGPTLKYVGTTSTVRDLVSLGDAIVGVGAPINYWGVSYGTVLGFNFINSELPRPFLTPITPPDKYLVLVFPDVRLTLFEYQTSY